LFKIHSNIFLKNKLFSMSHVVMRSEKNNVKDKSTNQIS